MSASWTRIVTMAVLLACAGTAGAASYGVASAIGVQINGRNSTGSFIDPVQFAKTESDFIDAVETSIGTAKDGATDVGTASIRASAFAAIGTDTPVPTGPTLGVQVAGSSSITRPFFGPGEVLEARGTASATMEETWTFLTPGSVGSLRVEGHFNLTGTQKISSAISGLGMRTLAVSQIKATSNMFSTVTRELRSDAPNTPDNIAARDFIPFVLTASPNGALSVNVTLEAFGSATVNGGSFGVPGVGFGSATFDTAFDHTLSWGGITKVTDVATGAAILDWTVVSASGFDYTQSFPLPEPVPVPPALVNMLAGLALTGWVSRSRAKC